MLVTRRENLVRNGRAKSAFKESQENDVSSKGKIVFQGVNREEKKADVIEKSPKADLPYSKPGHSRVRLDVFDQRVAVEEQCLMDSHQKVSGSGMEILQSQSEGMRSNFASGSKTKSKRNLGIKSVKSLKRKHPTTNSKTPSPILS